MSNETINRITILLSSVLSLLSLIIAFLTGGDLFFIITMRFLLIFALSSFLVWTALTIVNLVVIKAARKSIIELNRNLAEEDRLLEEQSKILSASEGFKEALLKGQNLDLTSEPQEELGLDLTSEIEETPEIKVFEPFKPRRIETDKT